MTEIFGCCLITLFKKWMIGIISIQPFDFVNQRFSFLTHLTVIIMSHLCTLGQVGLKISENNFQHLGHFRFILTFLLIFSLIKMEIFNLNGTSVQYCDILAWPFCLGDVKNHPTFCMYNTFFYHDNKMKIYEGGNFDQGKLDI